MEGTHTPSKRLSPKKPNLLVILLVVALVVALGYIVLDKQAENKLARNQALVQQGAVLGYEQAIVEIVSQAATCDPVPVFAENISVNLIAVECLQGLGS